MPSASAADHSVSASWFSSLILSVSSFSRSRARVFPMVDFSDSSRGDAASVIEKMSWSPGKTPNFR